MPRPIRSALRVAAWTVMILVIVVVLYVGSVGPAYRLAHDDRGRSNLDLWTRLDRVYAPIWWAANRWHWAGRYLRWSIGRDDVESL